MPINAWAIATTWAMTSHRQNHSPALRRPIHRTRPSSHPIVKIPTTMYPTTSWTPVTAGASYGAGRDPGRLGGRVGRAVPARARARGRVLVQPAGQVQALERELERGRGDARRLLLHPEAAEELGKPGQLAELREQAGGGEQVRGLGLEALREPRQDRLEVEPGEAEEEHLAVGRLGARGEDA